MPTLIIFNTVLILIIIGILILLKKICKADKTKNIILIVIPLITILCHYSSLVYHHFLDESAMLYLKSNPNLILPIYPCNVVMWGALILGMQRNKQSKFSQFLIDYIFWFGIVSTLVGMFANVDFIKNPTLKDFDITKGIVSHATLLLNSLILPVFGYVKVRLEKNILHIIISIITMLVIGLYCNLVFEVIGSDKLAYEVNSMFLIHSPFEGVPFLKYPLIATIALVLYFVVFALCEMFIYNKGTRWYNRIKNKDL